MTPNEILERAVNRSGATRNQQLATDATELFEVTKRGVRGAFAVAARVNPFYYAVQGSISFSTGWPWPSDVEAFLKLEQASVEVVVVPFDDKQAETSRPAVYALGRKFYTAGNAGDPTTGAMDIFYSQRAADPADANSTIDARFPDTYIDLLVADLALYLAIKDRRVDDVTLFTGERDRWLTLYVAHLEHILGLVEVRRKALVRRFASNSLVPLGQIFSGATG